MKCPKCNLYHRRGKYGMTCSTCKYKFVFSPKTNSLGLSDPLFQKILDAASAKGKTFYTPHQLFATSVKFLRKKELGARFSLLITIALVCVFICAIVLFYLGSGLTLLIAIGFFLTLFIWSFQEKKRFSFENWQSQVNRWRQAGYLMEGMIKKGALSEPPPEWKESDIYYYGVEGILICDQNRYVDFFVLNNFHTHQKLLVLSEAGYPNYLVAKANAMLDERADLPVYLMHDATGNQATMEDRVKQSGRFRIRDHPVTDLGLFNKNIQKAENLKWMDASIETRVPFDYFLPHMAMNGMALSVAKGVVLGAAMYGGDSGRAEAQTSSSSFG